VDACAVLPPHIVECELFFDRVVRRLDVSFTRTMMTNRMAPRMAGTVAKRCELHAHDDAPDGSADGRNGRKTFGRLLSWSVHLVPYRVAFWAVRDGGSEEVSWLRRGSPAFGLSMPWCSTESLCVCRGERSYENHPQAGHWVSGLTSPCVAGVRCWRTRSVRRRRHSEKHSCITR
jgi:hypothetical protein